MRWFFVLVFFFFKRKDFKLIPIYILIGLSWASSQMLLQVQVQVSLCSLLTTPPSLETVSKPLATCGSEGSRCNVIPHMDSSQLAHLHAPSGICLSNDPGFVNPVRTAPLGCCLGWRGAGCPPTEKTGDCFQSQVFYTLPVLCKLK